MVDTPSCLPPLPPPPPPPAVVRSVSDSGLGDEKLVVHFNRITALNSSRFESPHSIVRQLVTNLLVLRYKCNNENEPTKEMPVAFLSFCRIIIPVIQVGPSCGLVAVAMAGQLLTEQTLNPSTVMNVAVQHGYTQYGEMFSAKNMLSLALEFLPACSGRLLTPDVDRNLKIDAIVDTLIHNGAVLVPYDRDANGEPCLKRGHRAHWVLLTGVLWTVESNDLPTINRTVYEVDSVIPQLLHGDSDAVLDSHPFKCVGPCIFVFAVHGRSTRTSIWSLNDLLNSNDQLVDFNHRKHFSPDEEQGNTSYCLPPGGVREGLCGKIILLSKS